MGPSRTIPARKRSLVAFLACSFLAASLWPAASHAILRRGADRCDLVASPRASGRMNGSLKHPFSTARALVKHLKRGQTGCFRKGDYVTGNETQIGTARVTLRNFPGEHATIYGRIWIQRTADEVKISHLGLDGRNDSRLPSPTINADDVVLRRDDITNDHTGICLSVGSPHRYGRAHRTLIEGNRIHDCGRLPVTNQDHGIYVNSSTGAVIRNNWIYDNADRGIQLYSDAQRTMITGNVIDGNGEGILFGGDGDSASSNNIAQRNIVTNSTIRDNIDSYWFASIGTGNVARTSCVGGGPYDYGEGGIKDGQAGFDISRLLVHVPTYVNPDGGRFVIKGSGDPCLALPGRAGEPLKGILDHRRR
jgi:parallel beta-helix repeat protein